VEGTCEGEKSSQKLWQVLMVDFYMSLLEMSFIMDFSLLCLKVKWEGR
jgi:hypothetical protein